MKFQEFQAEKALLINKFDETWCLKNMENMENLENLRTAKGK